MMKMNNDDNDEDDDDDDDDNDDDDNDDDDVRGRIVYMADQAGYKKKSSFIS